MDDVRRIQAVDGEYCCYTLNLDRVRLTAAVDHLVWADIRQPHTFRQACQFCLHSYAYDRPPERV
jgi:hypothetical protein